MLLLVACTLVGNHSNTHCSTKRNTVWACENPHTKINDRHCTGTEAKCTSARRNRLPHNKVSNDGTTCLRNDSKPQQTINVKGDGWAKPFLWAIAVIIAKKYLSDGDGTFALPCLTLIYRPTFSGLRDKRFDEIYTCTVAIAISG